MARAMVIVLLVLLVTALVATAASAQPTAGASPAPRAPNVAHWHDAVHGLGIAGTFLAFLVLLGGAVLYLGFNVRGKPFDDPVRRTIRAIHMSGGALAIALGLSHYVGRCVQMGAYSFGLIPPVYAGALFLVVGLSGVLRFWTPKPLRKRWFIFAYIHRLAVIGALYFATKHALYQISRFAGK